jgi:TonB family protein
MPRKPHKLFNFIMISLAAHALLILTHEQATKHSIQSPAGQQWLSVSLSTGTKKTTTTKNTNPSNKSTVKHKSEPPTASHQTVIGKITQNSSTENTSTILTHLIAQNDTQRMHTIKTATQKLPQPLSIKTRNTTLHSISDENRKQPITIAPDKAAQFARQKSQRNFLLGVIQNRLLRYMYYPDRARKRGWEGEVTVTFHIDKNGYLHNIHLTRTSGYALLDDAALIAVRKMNNIPMSQWDEGFTPVALQLPVIYRLTNS